MAPFKVCELLPNFKHFGGPLPAALVGQREGQDLIQAETGPM